jgi:hypothetical protein
MTIITPYRDRPDHLAQFIPHMRVYLPDARILIVEQAAGKQWNREVLANVGFREYPDDFFVFHDIDFLPITVDYSPRLGVTQLASSTIQRYGYLGGVTMFDHDTYMKAGGYHNEYWGGRAGDNEMAFNLKRLGISVSCCYGQFRVLPHPRTGPEFIPELWERAQKPRDVQDQLGACEYEVVSDRDEEIYRHIVVNI